MEANEHLAINGGVPVRAGEAIREEVRPYYGFEELRAVVEVFQRGAFSVASAEAIKIKEFEDAFCEYENVENAIAVSSGTVAQDISLKVLDIGPGDEVIVPPVTFASTAYTVLLQGATPVFADIDIGTFNIDPKEIRKKVTEKTKAIIPVHWLGNPADMDEIVEIAEKSEIFVVEDCAHAIGAKYKGRNCGKFSDLACWSMQEEKIITSCGEGGILTTDDGKLADLARSYMNHGKEYEKGSIKKIKDLLYQIIRLGNNYRITEIQCAMALEQLKKINLKLEANKICAQFLDERLSEVEGLILQKKNKHAETVDIYYSVRFDRDEFSKTINEISAAIVAEGIFAMSAEKEVQFCFSHPLFVNVGCRKDIFPQAGRLAEELLFLPIHPYLRERDLRDIVDAVIKVAEAYHIVR